MCFPFSVDVSGEVIYLVNRVMKENKNVECWVRLPPTVLILQVASCICAYVQGVGVDVDRLILTYYNIYYSTVLNV